MKITEPIAPPWLKVIFDKALGFILLLLSSPMWISIAIAELTESLISTKNRGPLFYSEIRVSAGRHFSLYKFRILRKSAIEEIRQGAVPKEVENKPGSLTTTGRLLKKFGLDELAQLINIIKGDMSFVGPRPKPVAEYQAELELGVTSRSLLRAGLTGPAQIMKGHARSVEDERAADLSYVNLLQTNSALPILCFDLGILYKTILVVIKGTGE